MRTGETCEASSPEGSCGGLSLFLAIRGEEMAKPFKTYEELLLFLQDEKNLTIEDMDTARRILLKTSYFSLISGYKDTFKNSTKQKY